MKIILHHIRTKTVNSGNLGMMYQGALSLQMFVIPVLLQLFLNGSPNTFLHLPGRRSGKGYNQQTVNVYGLVFIRDSLDNTLHQHRCLSAAGRRTDQNVAVSGINDFLLLLCP